MTVKVCGTCQEEKPLKDFRFRKDRNCYDSYCIPCDRVSSKEYYKNNKVKQWALSLQNKYGITPQDYHKLFKEQNGKCAICGTADPGTNQSKFCVDHNHKTGKIRGLLCRTCNSGIGLLQDDPEVCNNAAEYLIYWED